MRVACRLALFGKDSDEMKIKIGQRTQLTTMKNPPPSPHDSGPSCLILGVAIHHEVALQSILGE